MGGVMNAGGVPTILVGVSGSPASAAALRWAEDEAVRTHGRLRIVAIWHPEQRAFYARQAGRADAVGGSERARADLVETVRSVLGPGPQPGTTAEVVEGTAERALVAESARADLLVLGAGPGLSIGPVVRTCLRQAHCPVVVVTPSTGGRDDDAGQGDDIRRPPASAPVPQPTPQHAS